MEKYKHLRIVSLENREVEEEDISFEPKRPLTPRARGDIFGFMDDTPYCDTCRGDDYSN